MQPQPREKLLFIINPGSGRKNDNDWKTLLNKEPQLANIDFQMMIMMGQDDEARLQERIKEFNPEKIVAVGGDGTVSLVAKIIQGKEIALGIIPAGSANGMARELNLPSAISDCIDIILNGKKHPTDIIIINKKQICLHLADLGMNARLIKYFDMGKLRGKLGYAKVLAKVFWRKELIRVLIKTPEARLKRKAFMVVLANAQKYGTGAVINPSGNLSDRLFELVIVRRLAFSEIFKTIFRPGPFNKDKIEIVQCSSVEITCRKPAHFQVDGEFLGKTSSLFAEIAENQLQIMVAGDFTQRTYSEE